LINENLELKGQLFLVINYRTIHMKRIQSYISDVLILVGLVTLISCISNKKPAPDEEINEKNKVTEVKVEAEEYELSNIKPDTMIIVDSTLTFIRTSSAGWIAFDVNIPIAGRYKSEINISSESPENIICWIEDYYDNKDDRTYNITSDIAVPASSSFITMSKDGSPLNVGPHKMKLHFDGGLKIDWIKFTLIREHEKTTKSIKQNTVGTAWEVVWSDEFDSPVLDTTNWTYDIGDWGWGNGELQYYTKNRSENARIENGNLIIEARKNDMGKPWTSARITTRGKISFTYGKIEFRAKLPSHKGNWAAGWTLGDEYVDELSWPYCGEIDILESVGYEMDDETGNGIAHASAHSGAYYFKLGNQPTGVIEVSNMKDEYHTYTIEWFPHEINSYVDGKHYLTYDDTSTDMSWPFNKPQNIILNLAMGGGWAGYYGMDESVTSQKMIIDYVRVYELR